MISSHHRLANNASTFGNSWKKKKRANFAMFRFDWKRTNTQRKLKIYAVYTVYFIIISNLSG